MVSLFCVTQKTTLYWPHLFGESNVLSDERLKHFLPKPENKKNPSGDHTWLEWNCLHPLCLGETLERIGHQKTKHGVPFLVLTTPLTLHENRLELSKIIREEEPGVSGFKRIRWSHFLSFTSSFVWTFLFLLSIEFSFISVSVNGTVDNGGFIFQIKLKSFSGRLFCVDSYFQQQLRRNHLLLQ